jgi:hypothetical protein
MNLPFFNKFKKKILPLYYLVLVLRDEKAQAVIFEEIQGVAKIIGQREEHFTTSIDQVSEEELLEKLDKAISSAEYSLPENVQTQKTIFGVKESWTDNDQIKKEYLSKLKKVSEELQLIPIGFLVISQAISHLLQKEEGVPVSAILVEINKKNVTVTLLRAGKNIETRSSDIHDSIPFTVDTVLKHFNTSEILPSRIILFNGQEDLSQEFISHTWSKSLPFLHLPQITNLPYGFDSKAVLFGAATQMGFEVLEKDLPKEQAAQIQPLGETPMPDEKLPENEEPVLSKNLGAQNFGFAKDVDVAKMEFEEPTENPIQQMTNDAEEESNIAAPFETDGIEPVTQSSGKLTNILMSIKNILIPAKNFILNAANKVNIKGFLSRMPFGKLSILFPAILIIIAALTVSYFMLLKATITITLDPKISEQTKSVTFSTAGITDPDKNIIKGEFVSVSEDGSASIPVTGKKDVGTPAKGTVTIFNSLSETKTLDAGTTIKSPNGLEFTLDSSVTINSVASHSADETVTPQSVSVGITASQLGKESNLPSGTKFSVGYYDSSDLIAKNDNPFSGGTKSQVTVVSKADLTKLEGDLLKQLETKAKEDLQKQLSSDKILLPAFVNETLSKEQFSAKIGDEAKQLTLTGTAQYQGISYGKSDIAAFSKSLLSKNIPPNQEIDYNNIRTLVLNISNKNTEEIDAKLDIKALLLPKIDKNKLIKDIKGKSLKVSEDLISKLPQVAEVSIKFSPDIPFLPKSLPSGEKNIIILIRL